MGRSLVEMKLRGIGLKLQCLLILLARFLEPFLLVEFLARGRARRVRNEQRQCQQQRQAIQRFASAFVHEHGGHDQCDPQPQRPLVTLDGPVREPGVDLLLLHFSEPFSNEPVHVGGTVLQPRIEPAGRFRNSRERLFVQSRFHKLPIRPFDKLRAALLAGNGNERAVRRADANGEDPHRPCRFACRINGVRAEIFAICKKHQAAALAFALAKRVGGRSDRLGDVRAAERNDIGIQFIERGEDGGVIDR